MIYVFLADGFEETEAITTIDYLRRCELEVKTVGVKALPVIGSHKIKVIADILATDVELKKIDMIVLPGGMPGTINLEQSKIVNEAIDYCAENNKIIAAICAAPSILGHKGLLKGKDATCFAGFEDELFGANFKTDDVVIDGNIITSRSAGTANQFSFALVTKLLSKERADLLKDSVIWKK